MQFVCEERGDTGGCGRGRGELPQGRLRAPLLLVAGPEPTEELCCLCSPGRRCVWNQVCKLGVRNQ